MEETWVPVIAWVRGKKYDFTGYYEVSEHGIICGVERNDSIGRVRKRSFRKPQYGKDGYFIINLYKDGKSKTFAFSRVVYESFNGEIPEGMQVNHINEDKTDNRIENLNLMTPKENANWGTRTSRQIETQTNRPDLSKTVYQYDLDGNLVKVWPSAKEVQRVLGYANTNITACCNKTKYHEKQYAYGYIWKRKGAA